MDVIPYNEELTYLIGWIQSKRFKIINHSLDFIECDNFYEKKFIDKLDKKANLYGCKDIDIKNNKTIYSFFYSWSFDKLPDFLLKKEILIPYFIRGLFEGSCYKNFFINNNLPECRIIYGSEILLKEILHYLPFKSRSPRLIENKNYYEIKFKGNEVLDFLYFIYRGVAENKEYSLYTKRYYQFYKKISQWTPQEIYRQNCLFSRQDLEAIAPSKSRASDSGWDLTLIKKIKVDGKAEYYDTGISVKLPFGYYFDLVARSSISKYGYTLANNIGIIDRTYIQSIKVVLIKIDDSRPDLKLPCKIVQIIPRLIHHFDMKEIYSLKETGRGKGFGSSDKIKKIF
jgi:deoxyuridine 5'-triphosphate nucleotidohydrolase